MLDVSAGVSGGDGVRLGFVVGGEQVYRIEADPRGGGAPLCSGDLRIVAQVDEPPDAVLLDAPVGKVALDAGEALSLRVELRDDHGLAVLEVVVRRQGEELSRNEVRRFTPSVRSATVDLEWSPLSDLAGGEFVVVLEARDNDTVGGPKRGGTDPLHVQLLTPRDRHERVAQAQWELLDAAVHALGEHLLWEQGEDHGEARPEQARERMEELFARAALLREAFGLDPLLDAHALEISSSAVDDLARTWSRLEAARTGHPGTALADHRHNLERATLILDQQVLQARRDAAEAASRDLAAALRQLEQALASGGPTHRDSAAIEQALDEVRRRLAELGARLAEMGEAPVLELANVSRHDPAADALARIEALIREGRTDEALELLARQEALMAGMGDLQGAGSDAEIRRIDQLIGDVERIAGAQHSSNRAMGELADRFPDAVTPSGLEALDAELEALQQSVSSLAPFGIDPRLVGVAEYRLGRDLQYLERADQALAQADLDRTIREVALGDSELLDLLDLGERVGDSSTDADTWQQGLADAEAGHLRLVERLLVAEHAWRAARARAADSSRETSATQRAVATETASLTDQLSEEMDGLAGAEVQRDLLGAAEQLMRAAADDLDTGKPRRAVADGEEALMRLRQVQSELERIREMASGSAAGLALGATGSWGYFEGYGSGVDIPPPDRRQRLEDLRRAALAAATEDAPPSYQPQNTRYYEELVR